jgi:DNA-binding CsgD family transcriptional regulator/PAS domain-containing protein
LLEEAGRLTELIYDAALDADQWPLLLKAIASAMDAQGAMLRQVNMQTGHIGFFETLGYDPVFALAYREHFHQLDYYQPHYAAAPVGVLLEADQCVSRAQRLKSEYFNDYERPQDKVHNIGGVLARDGNETIQFGFHRGMGSEDYTARDRRLLQTLLPHLVRAIKIRGMLTTAEYKQELALGCLDQLRIGVLLLDGCGRIVYLNREAEKLMSSGFVLASANDLSLPRPEDTKTLRRLIAMATGRDKAAGGDMRYSVGTMPCHLWATPLPHDRFSKEFLAASGGVAVFVSREHSPKLPWQRVAAHYGLTPAEAKLAAALSEGEDLQAIAERFSIAYGTARHQLKSIFAKTGARRQSELVAMLLQSVLALCRTEVDE